MLVVSLRAPTHGASSINTRHFFFLPESSSSATRRRRHGGGFHHEWFQLMHGGASPRARNVHVEVYQRSDIALGTRKYLYRARCLVVSSLASRHMALCQHAPITSPRSDARSAISTHVSRNYSSVFWRSWGWMMGGWVVNSVISPPGTAPNHPGQHAFNQPSPIHTPRLYIPGRLRHRQSTFSLHS